MLRFLSGHKTRMVEPDGALPGRDQVMPITEPHHVSGRRLQPPYPQGTERALFGMGCFWGAERKFWETPGVWVTAVGYAGGYTPNPTYDEVCSAKTGHTETVLVVYDPAQTSYEHLLKVFWESHNPTQGMRQGNDVGTQYRSYIGVYDEAQRAAAQRSRDMYAERLSAAGHDDISTEIADATEFYFAEDHHQQYLSKVPHGYCGLGGTGVSCPVGLAVAE